MIEKYLKELVAIASYSGEEVAIADYLKAQLKSSITHHLVVDSYSEHGRSVAFLPDQPVLLLDAHLDTVPPGDLLAWNTPPLQLTDTGTDWIGLGAEDDKVNIALCLELLRTCDCSRIGFVFPGGEEVEAEGLRHLVDQKLLPKAPFAIALEGTDLQVLTAHKGITRVHTDIHGKAAHSSMPELGINAIYQAGELMQSIHDRPLDCIGSDAELGKTTLTMVMIHGGDVQNRIPDHCEIDMDARLLPGQTDRDIGGSLRTRLAELHIDATVSTDLFAPGMKYSGSDNHLKRLQEAGAGILAQAPFWTHAACYEKQGIPAVVFGPSGNSTAHSPNEAVNKAQVLDAFSILERLIKLQS